MVDPAADRPLYRQVADLVRSAIEHGHLGPGEALPSERQLGQALGVSALPTVRNAYRLLRDEGRISSARGRLSVVMPLTELASIVAELRTTAAELAEHPTTAAADRAVRLATDARALIAGPDESKNR